MAAQSELDWRYLLTLQDGVLSRMQALRCGMTEHAWNWLHTSQRWQSLIPGVSVAHSGEPTAAQRRWGVVLHCGTGAALTADHALIAHGVKFTPTQAFHVAIPQQRVVQPARLFTGEAVVVHRVRLDGLVHPGVPAALSPAPAALHALAFAPSPRAGEWRLAATVQQRVVTVPALRAALERLPRLQRRALARAVLDDVEFGAHARSELDFLALVRRNRLPFPDRLQALVRANGKRYLDAWWERPRVGAEIDGGHHVDVDTWGKDTLRGNAVQLAQGDRRMLLLRFTTGNLRHDEPEVVRQLRTALG